MKIIYISDSIIPSRSANSIHVMKMCQALADNGYKVVLLAPDIEHKYEKSVDDVYEYYRVKKNFEIKKLWYPNIKGNFLFYTMAIIFYLFLNKNIDLVYGRFLHGCYAAMLLKKKVIFELHENIFKKKKHIIFIFKKLIKNTYLKKLIVISEALKNIYLKKKCLKSSIIQVAHDGSDEVTDFDSRANILGIKNNLKIGYVGHLYKGKGMEVIASIADQLDNDIEIHIVGGLEKDIKLWKTKINHNNIFFYGYVPHWEVSSYINSFDVCLLPNQKIVHPLGADNFEKDVNISDFTSPLKLFEYMAHKKPIIASDLPVIREVLNEKNSILVECDNFELWKSSIQKLRNLKNREVIAKQAFVDFHYYTWKNRVKSII